ncbi:MAG: hypothetical protein RL701_2380 [Pseudomonadota bacterium]
MAQTETALARGVPCMARVSGLAARSRLNRDGNEAIAYWPTTQNLGSPRTMDQSGSIRHDKGSTCRSRTDAARALRFAITGLAATSCRGPQTRDRSGSSQLPRPTHTHC